MLSNGVPNMKSCSSLFVILFHLLEIFFTVIVCSLFLKHVFICFRAFISNPYALNFAINKFWLNVSKAFDRSIKIAQIYTLPSNLFSNCVAYDCFS